MRYFTLVMFLGLVWLSACATPAALPAAGPTSSHDVATPTPPSAKGTIRLSLPPSPGISDVPYLMALDRLREQGYTVETEQFSRFELGVAAVVEGNLDIISSSMQPVWSAIGKGAPVRTILARLRNSDLIVTNQEIQSCSDLADKSVGLSSATVLNAVLLNQYIARHCPGTVYNLVAIPSSSNRVVALSSGNIDASNLRLEDMLDVEQSSPGKFRSLVDFGDEFPEIQAFAYHAHQRFLAEHPDAARDFIRAYLEASRQVQDKQVLGEYATKYLSADMAVADHTIEVLVEKKSWDVNGGLTAENVKTTLDFLIQAEAVPDNLTPDKVADLQYLNAVLDEMGRE